MNELEKDFIKKYGEDKYKKLIKHCGHHALAFGGITAEQLSRMTSEERLVFALLEILDFQCYNYNCPCNILSEKEIKDFLLKWKERILNLNIPVPSMLGLFVGVFDFLSDKSTISKDMHGDEE